MPLLGLQSSQNVPVHCHAKSLVDYSELQVWSPLSQGWHGLCLNWAWAGIDSLKLDMNGPFSDWCLQNQKMQKKKDKMHTWCVSKWTIESSKSTKMTKTWILHNIDTLTYFESSFLRNKTWRTCIISTAKDNIAKEIIIFNTIKRLCIKLESQVKKVEHAVSQWTN